VLALVLICIFLYITESEVDEDKDGVVVMLGPPIAAGLLSSDTKRHSSDILKSLLNIVMLPRYNFS
jgi:hypothetical protein